MSSGKTSPAPLSLVKLCVGAESVQDLIDWQESRRAKGADGRPRHVTRMWPKRESELLAGGSLYWVIKGVVLCRQRIVALDEVIRHDGVRMCALVLDPEIIRTQPQPRRPFQGWRYLPGADAPADVLRTDTGEIPLPPKLQAALAEIGVV